MHESVAEGPPQHLHIGQCFRFRRNWTHFLKHLDKARTAKAEENLSESVGRHFLVGKTFLDIGSGSGLLSFAARRLDAVVTSFYFDAVSVACNEEFRRRFSGVIRFGQLG